MSQVFEAVVRVGLKRAGRVAWLTLALLAIAPAAAMAERPRIFDGPDIAGTARVGQTLQAVDYRYSSDGRATWTWWRCTGPQPNTDDCAQIDGADRDSYRVTDADRGRTLRVVLFVSNRDGYSYSISPQTAGVTSPAPPSPSPTPAPTPRPKPTPTPTPTPVTTSPQPQGNVLGETVRPALMMSPTPLVRIRGVLTRTGVKITLLTVRAPKGARITMSCKGKGCPAKKWAHTASLIRAVKFQRRLRAGTRLTITVTKAGWIGKHTTIKIRKHKVPKRSDLCIYPGARKPAACPAR